MANIKKPGKRETISVTLAVPPSEKINDAISAFVRGEFGEDVVVEISVKPEILGGAIFIFEGFYRDYSLLTKLTEAFETRRDEIATTVKQ